MNSHRRNLREHIYIYTINKVDYMKIILKRKGYIILGILGGE